MTTVKGAGWPVSNGYAPEGGPKALPISLDFTTAAAIIVDLVQEVASGAINMIQSVYVDNSNNLSPLTILWDQTAQRIVVPPTAQGMFPVITPKDNPRFQASSAGAVVVGIILLNVPMPLTQTGPITLNVANVNPPITNAVNRGGFIAAGGVSQQLVAANVNRRRLLVENPTTEVESLFINFGANATLNGAAAPDSIEITPGGYFDSSNGPISGEAVNIIAATINHKIIAKEW